MPQNITLPAPAFVLAQIVANEGPVDDDNQLGRPYFRHVPGGCSQWSLIYTRDGAGLFEYPEWTHRTGRGEAVLLRPGTPLFFRRPDDAPVWNQMWAQFHPRPHWYAWLDWPVVAPGVMHLGVANRQIRREIEALFRQCVAWANRPSPHWEDRTRAAFEQVLLACEACNPNSARHQLDPRLLAAMDYLSQHLAEPVLLPQVARAAGLSVSALGTRFRGELRSSPMRYLEDARLNRAVDLLRHTPLPIKEVAELVGYENQLYFSRRFKARLGRSPRAYRRAMAGTGG